MAGSDGAALLLPPPPPPVWRRVREAWSPIRNLGLLLRRHHGVARERHAQLDGLRALAALWVIAAHCVVFVRLVLTTPAAQQAYVALFRHPASRVLFNGVYGVDIFFILSGYLICALLRAEFRGMAVAARPPR